MCKQAYAYAVKDESEEYEIASLKLLGRAYSIKSDLSKSIDYYNKALKKCDSLQLNKEFYEIKGELALVYSAFHQWDKALSLEKEVARYFPSAQSFYGIGVYYSNLQQYDSAYYYLTRALKTSNIYTKTGAYQSLLYLSRYPQYQKHMISFCDSLRFYEDSVQKLDKSKEIIAYQKNMTTKS